MKFFGCYQGVVHGHIHSVVLLCTELYSVLLNPWFALLAHSLENVKKIDPKNGAQLLKTVNYILQNAPS